MIAEFIKFLGGVVSHHQSSDVGDDDTEHRDPAHNEPSSDQPAENGHRDDLAISHRRHRYERPPQSIGEGVDVGVLISLDDIDRERGGEPEQCRKREHEVQVMASQQLDNGSRNRSIMPLMVMRMNVGSRLLHT